MSDHFDLIIEGGTVLFSNPKDPYTLLEEQVDIGVKEGRIARLGFLGRASANFRFKASHLHVLPGLIDTQVHFREPGMEHKEDIKSGSRSALLGGMTAFFEMPNTYPPTVTAKALENKIKKAKEVSYCDFAFFVGATGDNTSILNQLAQSEHCSGVKIFMGSSTGSLLLHEPEKLDYVLGHVKAPIAVHSEDEERLKERKKQVLNQTSFEKGATWEAYSSCSENSDRYFSNKISINQTNIGKVHLHPVWRDIECALTATKKIVALSQKHKRRVHILHVTTEEEILFLSQKQAYATVEVTPQHLSLFAPDCYDRLGTLAQMNPPIRDKRHQEALWRGVKSGVVTMLGSDHAPHTLEEKQKEYPHSPAGMPGVQTMLTLMLDHVNKKKLSLKRLVELLATNPHRYYGMKDQGLLQEGFKANLTVVDMKKSKKISKEWLSSKCAWSPFENKKTKGWPVAVLLNGEWAMREDEILGPPQGQGVLFNRPFVPSQSGLNGKK